MTYGLDHKFLPTSLIATAGRGWWDLQEGELDGRKLGHWGVMDNLSFQFDGIWNPQGKKPLDASVRAFPERWK